MTPDPNDDEMDKETNCPMTIHPQTFTNRTQRSESGRSPT